MADWKAAALAATVGGSVLLSGLTFTGTVDLGNIKNMGLDWANKVTLTVDETKEMMSKFNLFKADVTAQLNAKIAKINELNAKLSQLKTSGEGDLTEANNEIARLNEELDKANAEVKLLADELGLTDEQVQAKFLEMQTAESMDTALALDTQNPDTVVEEATTTPTEPTAPVVNDYTAEEQAIKDSFTNTYPSMSDMVVTMTDTQITLTSNDPTFLNMSSAVKASIIEPTIAPKTVTHMSTTGNTDTFRINQ